VATTVGETPKIFSDGKTGMLVPSGNVTMMADALKKLVENDDLRNALGSAASEHYQTNFTASCLARRHEDLYRSLVK
jgi:glycosyltransferase involved in cell wall biosynthesis